MCIFDIWLALLLADAFQSVWITEGLYKIQIVYVPIVNEVYTYIYAFIQSDLQWVIVMEKYEIGRKKYISMRSSEKLCLHKRLRFPEKRAINLQKHLHSERNFVFAGKNICIPH